MVNIGKYRTDLASEAHRLAQNGRRDLAPLPGVETAEERREEATLFRVHITDERGAETLGKPQGRYCTLEAEHFRPRGDPRFRAQAEMLSAEIRRLLPPGEGPYLAAGLGNEAVTPDALGPLAARNILATRHLKRAGHPLFSEFTEVAVCAPGVLGSSGMEAALQLKVLSRELKPGCLLVIDALAGAEAGRLCRTVQITDSGIAPGSGVGNDRAPLSRESLGLPVIALGVPTVIDAAFLGGDSMKGMFVTPKEIDEAVRCAARLIGYAVNLALQPKLSFEDLAELLD